MSIPLFCNGLRGTELSLNPSCYDTRHGLRLSTEKKYNLLLPRRMRQAASGNRNSPYRALFFNIMTSGKLHDY